MTNKCKHGIVIVFYDLFHKCAICGEDLKK